MRQLLKILLSMKISPLSSGCQQVPWHTKKMIGRTAAWVLTARCFVAISYGYLIGCPRHFSYGTRIGEVRILSPMPAMIIVGLTASPSVM